jgi:hypothetical protein
MIATEPLSIEAIRRRLRATIVGRPRTLGGRHVILTEEIRVVD